MEPKVTHADLTAFADRVVNLPKADVVEKRKQVNSLRDRLTTHIAQNPGFSLVKMLHAGSAAKGTALQTINDFDVAVYVEKADAPAGDVELLVWMAERLREAYGGLINPSQIEVGTHCVTITFVSTGTKVDVVPVLYEGDPDDRGYLIAKDSGARLLTSVRLHLDFVRTRKNTAPIVWAQVVRFLKWWVRVQQTRDPEFRFKSFMVELVCAHLVDAKVSFDSYPDALEAFFDYVVKSELTERISFTDFYSVAQLPKVAAGTIEVFDPVNPDNNVARLYGINELKRIVQAAEAALDAITEARYATTKAQAVECWQVVLGNRFRG